EPDVAVPGDRGPQDVVDVAAPSGDGESEPGRAGDGRLQHGARLEQVEVGVAVQLIAELARLHLDEPAGEVAVGRAEVAGDELDAFEEVGVHRAGERAEMVEQRNRLAVEVDEGIARLAAADDEQAAADGTGPRDSRKILDDLPRVALRSGNALDLRRRDHRLRKLLLLALAGDGGLVRALVERLQEIDDLLAAPFRDLLLRLESAVTGRRDGDPLRADRHAAQLESALSVRDAAEVGATDGDLDSGKAPPG